MRKQRTGEILVLAATIFCGAVACGQSGGPPADDVTTAEAMSLRRGVCLSSADCPSDQHCTTEDGVCNPPPGCKPGRPCPAICYGTCEPKPVACGPTTCPAGQVCCNASCGICTPPGGVCTQQICQPPPSGGPCATDSDCRTFSDTCTGCDCASLSICEKDPVCPGPGVQCFVDPCGGKQAFCNAGHCDLRAAPVLCPDGACGPQLGIPNTLCPDGTVAGPTGRCLQNPDGTCGWEIISCPDPSICGGGSPCIAPLEWCSLSGRCTDARCLSCCMFGTACTTAADCGGPACVTCPSGATVCSDPICATDPLGQCQFPQPACP